MCELLLQVQDLLNGLVLNLLQSPFHQLGLALHYCPEPVLPLHVTDGFLQFTVSSAVLLHNFCRTSCFSHLNASARFDLSSCTCLLMCSETEAYRSKLTNRCRDPCPYLRVCGSSVTLDLETM